MTKWVYSFGAGSGEGQGNMKELLGGKGAGLQEMSRLGIPVPPGFTITTEVCHAYYQDGRKIPAAVEREVRQQMAAVESQLGTKFGDRQNPLLVSVRSGARVSMPGMMDTVLNLGINDQVVEALIRNSNNPRFAYDSYRRFVQ